MTKIVFSTDNEIIAHSIGEIKDYSDYSLKGDEPKAEIGGIYDEFIFGRPFKCKCGATPLGKCPICGITAYEEQVYLSNYAYYQMHNYIITETKLLSLWKKLEAIKFILPKFHRKQLISLYNTSFDILPEGTKVDSENIKSKFEQYNVIDYKGERKVLLISEINSKTQPLSIGANGLYKLINYKLANGQSLSFIAEHVNSVLPIISPGLRKAAFPIINGEVIKHFPPVHFEYKAIIYADKLLTSQIGEIPLNSIDIAQILYLFNKMYNIHVNNSALLKSSKESLIRSNMGTRMGASMRWNAVSVPKAKLNEVFLPISGAYHALQSQIIEELIKTPGVSRYEALKSYMAETEKSKAAFAKVLDECKVVINRNPTLHRNNLMSFKPRIWGEACIGMNPYVCESYNLDFDGDQLACYFITDDRTKMLLGDKLNVENLWVFDKDHSPAFVPNPTCLFGLYSASLIRRKTNKKFDTFERMEDAFKKDLIQVDDQVILLPGKLTTYGREKISKILGVPLEDIIELDALDQKKLARVIAGLRNRPNKIQIIQDLKDFGNEIATLIGIDILPIKDLYKDMSPEVDKIVNNDNIPESIKLKQITDLMPKLLSEQLKKLPDNNLGILLSGARVKMDTLKTLYTPVVRLDSTGKVKVGDTSLVQGVSEEEYVSSVHTQRDILEIKKQEIPTSGYNQRQMVLSALDLRYTESNSPYKDDYIFIPKKLAEGRILVKDISVDIPDFVAVKSCATSSTNTVYRDELNDVSVSLMREGARIGIVYSKAITEFMTQANLKLKYGALLNDFTKEDIIALAPAQAGQCVVGDNFIIVGGLRYYLGENIIPTEQVLSNKEIKKGDKIAINANLLNVSYRSANFVSMFDLKVVSQRGYDNAEYYPHKAISYAPKNGTIRYENNKMYLDDILLDTLTTKISYFIPNNYYVKYGDRLSSAVLNLEELLKVIDKYHAFYLFYKELYRICKLPGGLNMDLAEVMFKILQNSNFSIKKHLMKQEDFFTRMAYGATKQGLKQAVTNPKNITKDLRTEIPLKEDNPAIKIILREFIL